MERTISGAGVSSPLPLAQSASMGVALGKPHPFSQTQFLPLEYGSVPRNLVQDARS